MAAEISRDPSSERAVSTSVLRNRVRSAVIGVSLATDHTTTLARFWSRAINSVNCDCAKCKVSAFSHWMAQ